MSLRNLIYSVPSTPPTNFPTEFLVYNTNVTTPGNGGFCCLWTVPAGTTFITFEMWGGGGGGAGGCCCMSGPPGSSGSYSVKTVCGGALAGCQYTICAGGTSLVSTTGSGCFGCTSYVNGQGLSNFCAEGGQQGCSNCSWHFIYTCCIPWPICRCAFGGDINIHGTQSTFESYVNCGAWFQQHAMNAPATVSGPLIGMGGCNHGGINGGTSTQPAPTFPGGGGFTAQAFYGTCYCGWYGAGGLVSITYG
jgi:hypothetical protein